MYVDFKELPDSARIWIYQSNRSFTEEELEEIHAYMKAFITQWTVHGKSLRAGYEIQYRRFIVLGLDQSQAAASGCSIDASVHFIQGLEKKYGVDLLDKMNVTFKQGEYVAYKPLTDFKKMAKDKAISQNTIVFNNLVNNKQEYQEAWEVPASESWHSRFF
ncbi:ABC transporter ATPase [Lentiprolixibacter aurantiacus]|uniref:ABC transporter ATPase n=1 Tax=Lentiprolixibacter aurantiacus TaxID=2993939 RepID=A0AAE3SPW7_9FLAO|nr:ABC transporter ATPase [Lentiprolixibacter aurantiacus]MCX2719882.1 ABC transporter ATPase [Lentiprolixibacter aurantiacus]